MMHIPIPSALREYPRLFAKKEDMLMVDMIAALTADGGDPESTRYASSAHTVADTTNRRRKPNAFRKEATRPATITRCAPETATRWAKPLTWKSS